MFDDIDFEVIDEVIIAHNIPWSCVVLVLAGLVILSSIFCVRAELI